MVKQKNNAPVKTPRPGWYGPFYSNSADPRVILPKPWGWGFTFNLARPATYAILLALVVAPQLIAAAVLFLAR